MWQRWVSPATMVVTLFATVGLVVCEHFEPHIAGAGDWLQLLRDEVRTPDEPTEPKPPQRPNSSSRNDCNSNNSCSDPDNSCDAGLFAAGAYVVGMVALAPFYVPKSLLDDDYANRGYFPRFPYEEELPGYLMIDPWVPQEPRFWGGRVRGEYGDDFSGLSRIGGGLVLDTTLRLGLDTEFNYRRQELGPGRHDELWTGDANLVFRFAQHEHWSLRSGLGFNWLADPVDANYGFNFTYAADWFPSRPWVVSTEMDLGTLGHKTLFHFRATAGVQMHGVEAYAGYDYFDVGSFQAGGLIGGVRLWF